MILAPLLCVPFVVSCGSSARLHRRSGECVPISIDVKSAHYGSVAEIQKEARRVLGAECVMRLRKLPKKYGVSDDQRFSLSIAPNPFCEGGPLSNVLSVDVELMDYGPANSRRFDAMVGYMMFGLVGALTVRSDSNAYVSHIQLRCSYADGESFLIRRTHLTDVELTSRASSDSAVVAIALNGALWELAQRLASGDIVEYESREHKLNRDELEAILGECGQPFGAMQ